MNRQMDKGRQSTFKTDKYPAVKANIVRYLRKYCTVISTENLRNDGTDNALVHLLLFTVLCEDMIKGKCLCSWIDTKLFFYCHFPPFTVSINNRI